MVWVGIEKEGLQRAGKGTLKFILDKSSVVLIELERRDDRKFWSAFKGRLEKVSICKRSGIGAYSHEKNRNCI